VSLFFVNVPFSLSQSLSCFLCPSLVSFSFIYVPFSSSPSLSRLFCVFLSFSLEYVDMMAKFERLLRLALDFAFLRLHT
jgi:hypothetical protein